MSEDLKMAKILKQELNKFWGNKETNLTAKISIFGATNLSSEINLTCDFLENEFDEELEHLSGY